MFGPVPLLVQTEVVEGGVAHREGPLRRVPGPVPLLHLQQPGLLVVAVLLDLRALVGVLEVRPLDRQHPVVGVERDLLLELRRPAEGHLAPAPAARGVPVQPFPQRAVLRRDLRQPAGADVRQRRDTGRALRDPGHPAESVRGQRQRGADAAVRGGVLLREPRPVPVVRREHLPARRTGRLPEALLQRAAQRVVISS